ncbi:MAG: hypothetical protein H7A12_00400 [Pseudomonadales bacterium]|jgi:hypothetical protein|nr:hypothetical protein [Pseudomonadales bacterium]
MTAETMRGTNNKHLWIVRIMVTSLFVFLTLQFSVEASAMGEKYSDQGGNLSSAVKRMLIAKGFCDTPEKCYDLLPAYGGHGDRVRSTFYGISGSNRDAFRAVLDFAITDGLRVTDGVPITIRGYHETHEEYIESGIFFKSIKPFLILEINK